MNQTDVILFFVRNPTPGKVKTRLAAGLDPETAAALYAGFVLDMLDALDQVPAKTIVCCAPDEDGDALTRCRAWLGQSREYLLQEGADLGQRMERAFAHAFAAGFERALLLGSDVPDFPGPLLAKALDDLLSNDAVVGPAMDGGYYCIGFRKDAFLPAVFTDMAWGGSEVYNETRTRLQAAGLEVAVLPEWNDVDTVRDLNALFRANRKSSFAGSRTYAALRGMEELLKGYDIDLPGRRGATDPGDALDVPAKDRGPGA